MQGFRSIGHGLEGAAAVGNIGITAIVETRERSANVDELGSTAVGADVEQIIESAQHAKDPSAPVRCVRWSAHVRTLSMEPSTLVKLNDRRGGRSTTSGVAAVTMCVNSFMSFEKWLGCRNRRKKGRSMSSGNMCMRIGNEIRELCSADHEGAGRIFRILVHDLNMGRIAIT